MVIFVPFIIKTLIIFGCLAGVCFTNNITAQIAYMPPKQSPIFSAPHTIFTGSPFEINSQSSVHFIKPSSLSSDRALPLIMYAPPREPFFCHMESNVHRHMNLWIKLRAGNDDSYMKMIAGPAAQ